LDFNKNVLIILLAVVMSMGMGTAFAQNTNTVTTTVTNTLSLDVIGNANFAGLAADNMLSAPQMITINSTSNVPINVYASANAWVSGTGNMPISALHVESTPMGNGDHLIIDNLPPGDIGMGNTRTVNLFMQVPFGSNNGTYETTVLWTAQPRS
jgi:hypothetical protein